MENLSKRKVGGIVAENFRAAKIFTEYGIDFCCKGGITLEKACEVNGVAVASILKDLESAVNVPEEVHFIDFGLSELIHHITSTHHSYVENSIPPLKAYLTKLVQVHGARHPELEEIKDHFFKAADALTAHMKKEELILFPYVQAMEEAQKSNFVLSKPHFGTIENPIQMMEEEHETEGERFSTISELSNGYQTPTDGCQTYKVAFAMLQEFEEDLHKHIHLENNILFPKATELYHQLNP